ncbi:tRNA dihydrouridine synthase DusB [Pleomorphochaeta sp. DL1XJH-081]|uniref:tRNA dihydrouridine synthase DusB n=1 Tax=Pleomorphochaeta sp. DL1XJH-081 TaxID=3409690 RepID=UPI003BB5D449
MAHGKTNVTLYHPVNIGNITIDGNLFLAPLAGYTDRAFRSVCIEHGASFTYTEMVSAEGLARGSEHTEKLLTRAENEPLLGVQIFMDEASVAQRSIERLQLSNPTVVDINCGCPVPKVVKIGAGSALLREPQKIHDIVAILKKSMNVPVSVKIRLGWDVQTINYWETTDAALSAGADMITMHARTRAMGYSGTADWEALADLKSFVTKRNPQVPVFGSGDLFTPLAAKNLLEQTHIDGVMFARGALGNPFIFTDTYNLLIHGEDAPFHQVEERVSVLLRQLDRMGKDVGERLACREMRKHAAAYLKGIPHASKAKQALVTSSSFSDYEEVCKELVEESRNAW